MKHKNNYYTTDFALACFLYSYGIGYQNTQRTFDPKKVTFVFVIPENTDIYETILKFWNGTATVEPSKLLNAQRFLQREIANSLHTFQEKGDK